MNASDARKAHELLDRLGSLTALSKEQEKLLRSLLPDRPKDATLEDLLTRVHAAWLSADPSDWGFDTPAEHHDWLFDLRNDLIRIIEEQDAPADTPAHPEFLETREDYENAPEGTVIAADSGFAYVRSSQNVWSRTGAEGAFSFLMPGAVRRVLRWGWVGNHE